MDDFLHNLRSGQLKSYRDKRSGYYHPNREKRADGERRSQERRQSPSPSNQLAALLEKLMPAINKALPEFLDIQNRIATSREKIYKSEIRKMSAMEEISKSLIKLTESGKIPALNPDKIVSKKEDIPIQNKKTDNFETLQKTAKKNREKAISIIMKMRNQKKTYDEIALFLTEQKYPTFSHRGEWHAQTVHRLFKKHLQPH